MDKDYLVFWMDMRAGFTRHADVVKLSVPPCEPPRGAHLEDLCRRALNIGACDVLSGVIELGTACWSPGAVRELALGNGSVASLECHSVEGWRVHV